MNLRGAASATLLVVAATACGSGAGSDGEQAKTLTYWASNQAAGIELDRKILEPELAAFQKSTGIKVNLEVIPWSDLQTRILNAAASGRGPDVVNIGNTWSTSLQATGAFVEFDDATLAKVGGKGRFLASSMSSTGAPGLPPGSLPLYGMAYGLYYNKKRFAEAGIDEPPKTWQELVGTARKLTGGGRYGLTLLGASYTEGVHFAWMFGRQNGASVFDGEHPAFDTPEMVAGVKRYLDLIAVDKVVNPSDAEKTQDAQLYTDFASGKAAMMIMQNHGTAGLAAFDMDPDEYGVVPIPLPEDARQPVTSHVAGINITAFAESRNREGALKFIEFMTSPQEQTKLNKAFGSLPVVNGVTDPAFAAGHNKVFAEVLATAQPLPMIPQEAQFETLVGTAVKDLFAQVATGERVTESDIKAKLSEAGQKLLNGG
ncbi:ABC transporter substrate-binding protein [Nonomuraea pusilla]|uniref:Carbohydrate ABC transporter substrate-binding protein, CUT1 family (TC 3.A.1.1.-) n=1 Tax=Nonomuraea pusilla TaxID=46177 RepID=A0A1H8JN53_9ACTN|nr:sugar ABC transporter substrate-binding protein [Nonomuraea pusilla]SEN82112.1 carbohydrate ABC transporter substrate-binding protein, CUT1 family (TC 3.A.1.1.-) [Nonomuraea pusilla]